MWYTVKQYDPTTFTNCRDRITAAESGMELFVCIVDALRAEGFQADEARWLCGTVVNYTFGFVIEEQAGPTADTIAQLQETGPHHPFLTALLEDGRARDLDLQSDFRMGLHYIITGAQASRKAARM